jgi:hypothetical protein
MALTMFVIAGFVGMVVHWAKKWMREQTKSNLYCYLMCDNPKYTAMAILTYLAAIAAILAVGLTDYSSTQSLAMAFMAGYMIDSAINKDKDE